MVRERFYLVDAQGVGTMLEPTARPNRHGAGPPQFGLARSYGYVEVLRSDDGRGSAQVVELRFRYEAESEAALEAKVRMWQAAAQTAVWYCRAGRSAREVNGGWVESVPVEGEYSNVADITLHLVPASLVTLGVDGQEVVW